MRKCGGRNVSPREPPDKQFERVDILDAMAQATVPEDGDAIEKATWPALGPLSTRKTSGEFDLGAALQCGIRIETAREPTTQSLLLSVPAMVR
jgi:hypothetical protein